MKQFPQQRTLNQVLNCPQVRGSIYIKKKVVSNSFYISEMSHWSRLSDECTKTEGQYIFRTKVLTHLWSSVKNRLSMANCSLDISDREPN